MEDKLNRIKEINIENGVWVIYIFIIIFSWIANRKEKDYILYGDERSRVEYQKLMILIFLVLVIIYYYFTKSSYEDVLNLNINDSSKKKKLTNLSFIGSMLVLISGVIFLYIVISDDNIDTEVAFN